MLNFEPETLATRLTGNALRFCRYLRQLGLPVGSSQVANFLRALLEIDITRRADVYYAAETTLVTGEAARATFREAFVRFWGGEVELRHPDERSPAQEDEGARRPVDFGVGEGIAGGDRGERRGRYSHLEVLRQKDFAEMTEEELAAVRALLGKLAFSLGERRTRRFRANRGRRPDIRRSLRANLRHGGEWLRWARRGPERRERPLVVLADISGSMERYSRLLLQFCYGLVKGFGSEVEAFAFGTRLTPVTKELKRRTVEEALRTVTEAVPDWSGGTRIGQCLREFNKQWARRVLARDAAVLLISDGWDRGEPGDLAREAARLSRLASRLIWLNPLLGRPDYRPLTRGMQAALPHVDDFLPAHNLASLEDLGQELSDLGPSGTRRPVSAVSRPRSALVEGRTV